MPFRTEHAARQHAPSHFKSCGSVAQESDGKPFRFVVCSPTGRKGHDTVVQSVRFPVEWWSVDEAKEWLRDHGMKVSGFEAALEDEMVATRRNPREGVLQTYSQFRPSAHDARGLGLPDQQDWLVLPTTRTRDSSALDESNFVSALKALGGESETVEVHRFSHWGPGWFEIILVAPGSKAEAEGRKIAAALENYPILDETDLSEREYEESVEAWGSYGAREFRKYLLKTFAWEDEDDVDNADDNVLFEVFLEAGGEAEHTGEGTSFRLPSDTETLNKALSRHGVGGD